MQWNSFSRIGLTSRAQDNEHEDIVIDADAATGIANFDFDHLTPASENATSRYQGPGFPYHPAARREDARHRPRRRLGCRPRARLRQQGHHRRRDQPDHRDRHHAAAVPANYSNRSLFPPRRAYLRRGRPQFRPPQSPKNIRCCRRRWSTPGPPPPPARSRFPKTISTPPTPSATTCTHLTDDGILAFTRWGFDPPRESLRLVSLASVRSTARRARSWRRTLSCCARMRRTSTGWGAQDTVLISRKPFTRRRYRRARRLLSATAKMQVVYLPGTDQASRVSRSFADATILTSSTTATISTSRPVSDDRPFFFYTVQPRDLWHFLTTASQASADYKINQAVPLLFGLVAVSIIATLVILRCRRCCWDTACRPQPGAIRLPALLSVASAPATS